MSIVLGWLYGGAVNHLLFVVYGDLNVVSTAVPSIPFPLGGSYMVEANGPPREPVAYLNVVGISVGRCPFTQNRSIIQSCNKA